MRRKAGRTLLVAFVAGFALFADADERTELRKLFDDLREAEMKLALALKVLPLEFDPVPEESFIRGTAAAAELPLEIKMLPESETVRFDDGRPSLFVFHRIEMSGRDDLAKITRFLEFLKLRDWRLNVLESLEIDAGVDGTFSFTARLLLPIFTWPDPPPAPQATALMIAAMHERLAETRANLATLEKLVERSRSGLTDDALALLKVGSDVPGVRITQVRAGEQLVMRGVVMGAAAREDLMTAMQNAELGGSRMDVTSEGACRPFKVVAGRGNGRPSQIARPLTDFDSDTVSLCTVEKPRALGNVVARGRTRGGLDVQLRNADVASVFFVLHDLTGASFILDDDVRGRLNLVVDDATLEEILAAMKPAGLVVRGGPLHRVSLAAGRRATVAEEKWAGEPVSLSLHNADLRHVLCLFSDITGLEITAPHDLVGRTTIFVADQPWDRVMKELLASAGMVHAIDGPRVFVGQAAAVQARAAQPGGNICQPAAVPAPVAQHFAVPLPVTRLAASDLQLLGSARAGEGRKAYAYAPWRVTLTLTPGDQLFDARVRSVSTSGVSFEDGPRVFDISFDADEIPPFVGAWECVSGACIDPEIEFAVEEKVRVFRSWLHHRPSALGTWSVEWSTITVDCCSGSTTRYTVVRANEKELVLREEGEKKSVRYRRIAE